MIPKKIKALFDFIDYLDGNKNEYVDKYLPLCEELIALDTKRDKLKPKQNYIDKREYDEIQEEISTKFSPITSNIYNPITTKLRDLKIWSGDDTYNSIWNSNTSAILDFKENFTPEDVPVIINYKNKYLNFRKETNTDFLCLTFAFNVLDETLKELFSFFKNIEENEFDSFEAKTIEVNDIGEALEELQKNKKNNVKFSIPTDTLFDKKNREKSKSEKTNFNNEIVMGDKIQVGNISNNDGQISVGKNNMTKTNESNDLAKKSLNWQKIGVIIAVILGLASIAVAIFW